MQAKPGGYEAIVEVARGKREMRGDCASFGGGVKAWIVFVIVCNASMLG
jgi:hypothetical protein